MFHTQIYNTVHKLKVQKKFRDSLLVNGKLLLCVINVGKTFLRVSHGKKISLLQQNQIRQIDQKMTIYQQSKS